MIRPQQKQLMQYRGDFCCCCCICFVLSQFEGKVHDVREVLKVVESWGFGHFALMIKSQEQQKAENVNSPPAFAWSSAPSPLVLLASKVGLPPLIIIIYIISHKYHEKLAYPR